MHRESKAGSNHCFRVFLKMSDAFLPAMTSMEPCLECTVLMLNINLGRNRELMEGCRKLKEYAMFVATVREIYPLTKRWTVPYRNVSAIMS